MASVLLYVLYPSHFKVMFRLAKVLSETGRFTPLVYFDRDAPFPRDLAAARAAGIACIGQTGADMGPRVVGGPAPAAAAASLGARAWRLGQRIAERVPAPLRQPLGDAVSFVGLAPKLALELSQVVKAKHRYQRLLEQYSVRLVIAPGDNVGYGTPILFKSAHEAGIKTLIVPFTVSNRLEMVADLRRHRQFSTARLENRLLAAAFPHWSLDHDGHRMVREHASRALVLQLAGVAPPDPWVLNSGQADAIAAESPFMWDYYKRAGLPEDRLRLTGTLGDDVVTRSLADAKNRRDALCEELGIARDRRIVLFSYGEYHYFFNTGRPSEFGSQEELTDFWLESLRAMSGYEVVLSLHPSLERDKVRHLEGRGVHIATWPIEDLIPVCDVYVVSISATTRIAIACGKPVVDHDVFDFDYDNFVGLDAVWIANTKALFADTLTKLASDEAFYQRAVAAQQAIAPRFGVLDGHSTERIIALVDELAGIA
jgi:hypothetical protein